jgi:rare lipoprotein A
MPTYASVTNLANNRTVIVRINDRGPYHDGRIIDLSHKAAELLGFYGRGTAAVRVRYFAPAPLSGDDTLERNMLAKQPWATHLVTNSHAQASPRANFLAAAVTAGPSLVVKKGGFEGAPTVSTGGWATSARPELTNAAAFKGTQ